MKLSLENCVAILLLPVTALLLLVCRFSPRFERWFFKDIIEEQYL